MRRVFLLTALLASLAARPAFADGTAASVGELQGRVVKQENEWAQLAGRRVRLEQESSDLGAEIERVQAEPAGVRRDFKLRELLASARSKADELTRVAAELRWRTSPLADARRELLNACDRALSTPSLTEAKRLELARLRTAQAALLAMPAAPLGKVAPVAADPLDGPRELKEKADLLRDSEDKLKREVQRLTSRIDDVERRRHLRERVGAVDDDMFGEAASNRKFARLSSTAASQSAKTSGSDTAATPSTTTGGATPTVGGALGGSNPSFSNNPPSGGGETGGRTGDTSVLRNLVDPSTLDELRRADGGDDLERQVRALKRAQGELEGMAAELERRARSLSTRADELKRQK